MKQTNTPAAPITPQNTPVKAKAPASDEATEKSRKQMLIATLLTVALWYVPYSNIFLYPVRLFITFIHESGHAIASVAVGGSVDSLSVYTNGEGLTYSRVPQLWGWLVDSAGYLGTALFGAVALHIGRMKAFKSPGRVALYVMGIAVWLITLMWGFHPVKDMFTIVVGGGLGLALLAAGKLLPDAFADFATEFLAIQCSLNALSDIRILLNLTANGHRENDAANMANSYGGSPTFWAFLWALCALGFLALSLKLYFSATKRSAKPAKAIVQ